MTTPTMEKIKVMLAFDEGKQIEYCYGTRTDWKETQHPQWDWMNTNYRVKPITPRKFVRWFLETETNVSRMYGPYHSKEKAEDILNSYYRDCVPKFKVVAFEMTEIPQNAS